jgi:hypothetical protein
VGGEIIIDPKADGSLEGTYRGFFSGLLGLDHNLKISGGTLIPYHFVNIRKSLDK